MKTCKTCKYWIVPNKEEEQKQRGVSCSNPQFVYNVDSDGKCPNDGLMYWDYESYSAGFSTGPDFGCIHHKRNES